MKLKWTLISFLSIVAISNATGQKRDFENEVKGNFPVNLALDEVNKSFTPPPFSDLKSAEKKKCEIVINYVNFPEEAKIAFEYAVSIYEKSISSPVPIMVSANWKDLEGTILALSGPASFHKNFNDAPIPNVYYPTALAEKLSGKSLNDEKDADIICSFDSEKPWYFGTDGNTPVTKYDFVSVVLHELAHGFGISGFLADENGKGKIDNTGNNPSAYDYYIYNTSNQQITDKNLFSSPSVQLHQQLVSNKLNVVCTSGCSRHNAKVYAPTKWKNGASIYHLKSTTSENELMSPTLRKGTAIHNPGENTFKVLNAIGWDIISYKLQEIKDCEKMAKELPVQTKFLNNLHLANSSVLVIYSTNYFSTKDSVTLKYNNESNTFEGGIPLNSYSGKVQYYFKSTTADNKTFTQPRQAPKRILSFRVGVDNKLPTLQHNPTKLISGTNPAINLSAIATDNLGIGSVIVEYKINNIAQEPVQLSAKANDIFSGNLNLNCELGCSDLIEYRIVAKDNSTKKNTKCLPETGFYKVHIFEPKAPVESYTTNFNSGNNDFSTTDFEMNTPAGFSDGNLHTNHPYQLSNVENQRYSLIAQLNTPVILKENGRMTFDEVVLVEPGEPGVNYTDKYFWDFVIVEGSKDGGKTWQPFIDGYDSGVNSEWASKFSSTLKSSTSSATGHENMFWQNAINLTENDFFSAGDTVLFRFRLASDKSVSGWGWAIDNLSIQGISTTNDAITADEIEIEPSVAVYPNPFSNNLFIDCSKLANQTEVVVQITNLTGKTVYRETKYDSEYNPKLQINLSGIDSGIYIASVTDADLNTITQKIIKN